jgi:hypothetical protein
MKRRKLTRLRKLTCDGPFASYRSPTPDALTGDVQFWYGRCPMGFVQRAHWQEARQQSTGRFGSTPNVDPPCPTASLLVQEAFPSWGYPARGSRHRLIRRMRAGAAQLGTLKSFSRSVIVEPVLAGLEAIDDRVARGRVML